MNRGYYPYETYKDAARRLGVPEYEVRSGIEGGSMWWAFNREHGRYEVAREGAGDDAGGVSIMLTWIGDFIIGKKFGEGFFFSLIWLALFLTVMWPLTLCGLVMEYAIRGDESVVGQAPVYEGGGIFDEVSSRSREDLHWMLGIGKYEGRGY